MTRHPVNDEPCMCGTPFTCLADEHGGYIGREAPSPIESPAPYVIPRPALPPRRSEDRMSVEHLWDIHHPYYATQGNYYSNDCHTDYPSWSEFLEAEGDSDLDMNLVYRWDWQVPDPDNYEDEPLPPETLDLFCVGQRKALHRSVSVEVQREDEPAVRAWLTVRADHMRKVWGPLL